MNTVGLRIWRETTKFVENEKCILQDLHFGAKTDKRGK